MLMDWIVVWMGGDLQFCICYLSSFWKGCSTTVGVFLCSLRMMQKKAAAAGSFTVFAKKRSSLWEVLCLSNITY